MTTIDLSDEGIRKAALDRMRECVVAVDDSALMHVYAAGVVKALLRQVRDAALEQGRREERERCAKVCERLAEAAKQLAWVDLSIWDSEADAERSTADRVSAYQNAATEIRSTRAGSEPKGET